MNYSIIKNHHMGNDIESAWIPMQMNNFNNSKSEITSLQIIWDNVTGTLNGFINIFVTNNINFKSLLVTYNINTNSNKNSAVIIEINPIYSFLKINYSKNQITSGQLNVIANFKDL